MEKIELDHYRSFFYVNLSIFHFQATGEGGGQCKTAWERSLMLNCLSDFSSS